MISEAGDWFIDHCLLLDRCLCFHTNAAILLLFLLILHLFSEQIRKQFKFLSVKMSTEEGQACPRV